MAEYTHRWRHRKWPAATFDGPVQQDLRRGQRCRVLAVGRNGNMLVEFEDGHRIVGVRYCATATPPEPQTNLLLPSSSPNAED